MSDVKTGHTPGPWKIGALHKADEEMHRTNISGPNWSSFATVVTRLSDKQYADGTGLANLHLMAAAPDLLEALEAVDSELWWCAIQLGRNWKDKKWRENSSVGRAYDKALAAIAKARGRG